MRNIPVLITSAALLCILSTPTAARASSCHTLPGEAGDSGASGAQEIDTLSLQFSYQFAAMDRFKEGGAERSLDEAKSYKKPDGTSYTSVPIRMDMVRYTVTAGYEFSPRFKALLSLPYVRNTMDMSSSLGVMLGWQDMTMAPTSGVGDAVLMGLYRLSGDGERARSGAVRIGLGVKAPTGSSTERYANGRLVHFHMQPGTGSWDPLLAVMYSKTVDHLSYQADAAYHYATRNNEGYEAGDTSAIGVTGRYAVSPAVAVSAGLTYMHAGRASDAHGAYYNAAANNSLMDDPANTGGDSLRFSPGIQVFPMKDLALEGRVQVPLWERVNGIQLVAGSILSAAVSYRF